MRHTLLCQATATLFMTGVIWSVQVVHYPLMARVGPANSAIYEREHSRLTTWVVALPMLMELAIALSLLWRRPAHVSLAAAGLGSVLIVVIWLSTFLLQVPQHEILSAGFNQVAHQRLVATHWIRTFA